MKSLAIWTKKNDSPIELHINVWKLPKKGFSYFLRTDFKRVLDIGIKIKKTKDSDEETINIFYPSVIKHEDIQDLICTLINNIDSKLMSTLFNENLSLKTDSNNDYAEVYEGDNIKFNIYKIKGSQIKIENKFGGSLIEIKLPSIPKSSDYLYIRFRINKDYSDLFINKTKQIDNWFLSSYKAPELFDIRINEIRELNNELLEHVKTSKSSLAVFDKINAFYICSVRDEVIFSHIPFNNARLFEHNKWRDYIELDKIKNLPILAYHYKKSKKVNPKLEIDAKHASDDKKSCIEYISDYNLLIQTKYEKNNILTLFKYLVTLFVLALLFNFVSSVMWDRYKINSTINSTDSTINRNSGKKAL